MHALKTAHDKACPFICFKKHSNKIFIQKKDIIMVARAQRKIEIITQQERFTVNCPLYEIEKKLDDPIFFRCHQSYLINLSKVSKIFYQGNKRYVAFEDIHEKAEISRENVKKLCTLFTAI